MVLIKKEFWKTKWARNTERAVDNYREAIELVDVNPMEKAAEAAPKWKAKLLAFIEAGLWPEIMRAIPFETWRKFTTELGVPHFPEGVRVKAPKQAAFVDGWYALLEGHLAKIYAIPPVTDADRERRMIENRRGLIAPKGKWRR